MPQPLDPANAIPLAERRPLRKGARQSERFPLVSRKASGLKRGRRLLGNLRTARGKILLLLWILSFAAIPVVTSFDHPGWDAANILHAARAVHAGHDPYLEDMTALAPFERNPTLAAETPVPLTYVYPPITLPALRIAATLPVWLVATIYCLFYILAILGQVAVCMQFVETDERPYLAYLAPVAAFFPGLLASDSVIGGNVAYILYALALGSAYLGWKGRGWRWFYLAVILASCVKPPLVGLMLIPVLSGRRQWLPAASATAISLATVAIQPLLWPTSFQNYLHSFQTVFRLNRDFGCSPVGLYSGMLFDHGITYSRSSFLFYLCYALPLLATLIVLSRRFHRGELSCRQWLPVMLTGVILLNPRLIEYDLAPLAIPLALIFWRFLLEFTTQARAVALFACGFLGLNLIAGRSWLVWKQTDGILLILFFLAGCWTLLHSVPVEDAAESHLLEAEPEAAAV